MPEPHNHPTAVDLADYSDGELRLYVSMVDTQRLYDDNAACGACYDAAAAELARRGTLPR